MLAINWLLMWLLFRSPKVNQALEGSKTILVKDGIVDEAALRKETLTPEELISILNKNGFDDPREVELCVLEPNGTFFVKARHPSTEERVSQDVMEALRKLTIEVKELRIALAERG